MSIDPATADPDPVDWDFPPSQASLAINSQGSKLFGLIYLAQGRGPHPTAVLLHGAFGYEKNLDLAQAIRRSGWHALFFHYRGFWGSQGSYTPDHALEDVLAVVDFLLLPGVRRTYRIDPGRLALIGHSLGGSLAMMAGAQSQAVSHIGFLAGANLALFGREATEDDEDPLLDQNPIEGLSWPQVETHLARYRLKYELLEYLPRLDGKTLLLVGAGRDQAVPVEQHHEPLARQFRQRNKANLTEAILDADHDFSSKRIALASLVTGWLRG